MLDHAQIGTEFGHVWGTFAVGSALLTLFVPASVAALALLFFAQLGFSVAKMPDVANLGFVHLVVCATGLTGLSAAWITRKEPHVSSTAWLGIIAPAIRLEMLTVYAWAFWHKLNWGFLDSQSTCAVPLYEITRRTLHTQFGVRKLLELPPGEDLAVVLMVATLAVEGGMPLLLLFRRTRNVGIAVALGFHVFLGLGYFYAFSALAASVLMLFAPDDLVKRIERRWNVASLHDRRRYRTCVVAALLVVSAGRLYYAWRPDRTALEILDGVRNVGNHFGQYLFVLYLPAFAWAVPSLFKASSMRIRELLLPPVRFLLIFPILTAFNGACPYLGLKNEYSFAMYSNLRTEGGRTNHIVPVLAEIAGYQRDLVQVLTSSNHGLAELGMGRTTIPFQELHRRVQILLRRNGVDFSLTYVRNGQEKVVPSVEADIELGRPLTLLERKLMRLRDIPFEYNKCCH